MDLIARGLAKSSIDAVTNIGKTSTNEVSILNYESLIPNKAVLPNSKDWDITAALQKANDDAKAKDVRALVKLHGLKYKITSTITLDSSYVGIDGEGAILDASSISSGSALYITGTKIANNLPVLAQTTSSFSSFSLEGDTTISRGKVGTVGIEFNSATSAGPTNVKFYNVGVHHFEQDVIFKNHAYILTFIGCTFSKADRGIYEPSGFTDYGERITFISCTFANCNTAIRGENPNGSLHFQACSFDYCTGKFFEIVGTQAFLTDCHIEGAGDAFPGTVITLSGNGAYFNMKGGKFLFGSQTPTYPNVFDVQVTDENKGGGVYMDGVFMFNVNPTTGILASGNGHVTVKNWFSYDTTQNFALVSTARNNLLDGAFEMTKILDNWFIFQDASAVTDKFVGTNMSLALSTEQFKAGTQSLKVSKTATGGSNAQFALAVPASDARRYGTSLNYKKVGSGSGTVYADMRWAIVENNASGIPTIKYNSASISAKSIVLPTTDVDWTNLVWSPKLRRPAWATHMIMTFNISNLSSGTAFYLDECLVSEM